MDRSNQIVQHGVPVSSLDAAHANEYFEQFVNASSLKNILGYYRGLIDSLHLRPNVFNLFYPKLRANLTSWRAKALLKKFDSRASHKCYQKGKAAANTRVLVIGGGPCGMRTAIEAQLLGAKVVVVEKRDRFSRNNVLHLWPFVIEDLRMLGAKKFFGKFCAGAIDHISIRQLQCILLKVALLLGVEVHTEVSFETLVEPDANEKIGWRAQFKPANHPVSQYEFDVIIGADGKRNTLQGFSRKEFRGKLAIAITANFINKKTEAEARVEEISGVAFIFNQKFFKDLQEATRIDLENIVYYKDDTHYFVMTAKKHSLIEKGVIKQDFADTEKLLAPENVDKEALQQYAIEAATFSTNYQMPNLEFAVNHYGQPDIAMFDFTSMYAAENASKVVERNGYRLLKILVGDSLLEPFWPTGSGCARGFLSSLDAAWAIRSWSLGVASSLEVLAERESIYRLLAQTTPDNLNKDWKSYTLDPATRYPNFNKTVVLSHHVLALFDTDNPASIERMKRTSNEKVHDIPKKRRRGNLDNEVLLNWLTEQLKEVEGIEITEMGSVFKDGKVLCAIIHHYRPDLLEYSAIINNDAAKNNQIAINILEKDLGIPPVMTGSELTMTEDFLSMASYLTEIYDCFRGEIPHVKHPKLDLPIRPIKSMPPIIKNCVYIPQNDRQVKDQYKTCKKCFNAYYLRNRSSDCYYKNKLRKLVQTNLPVICVVDSKNKFQRPEPQNNLKPKKELYYKSNTVDLKNSEFLIPTRHKVLKNKKNKAKQVKLRVTDKNNNLITNNLVLEKKIIDRKRGMSEDDCLKPEIPISPRLDKQLKCIEKMYQKHERLKRVLTQLIRKRRSDGTSNNHHVLQTDYKVAQADAVGENVCSKVDQLTHVSELHVNINIDSQTPTSQIDLSDKLVKTNPEILPSVEQNKTGNISSRKDDVNTIFNNSHYQESSVYFSVKKPISETHLKIRILEKNRNKELTLQTIEYISSTNELKISSKIGLNHLSNETFSSPLLAQFSDQNLLFETLGRATSKTSRKNNSHDFDNGVSNQNCQLKLNGRKKIRAKTMIEGDGIHNQIFSRVSNWISSNDFFHQENKADTDAETIITNSRLTDITSVSKMDEYDGIVVEERTDVINFSNSKSEKSSEEKFVEKMKAFNSRAIKNLSKFSQYSPFQLAGALKSHSAPPTQFSVIVEGEELPDLPVANTKMSEVSFKTIKTSNIAHPITQPHRPSSRHKHKHTDMVTQKVGSVDRKPRKRRTMEKVGASVEERQKMLEEIASNRAERHNKRKYQRKLQTEQFIKSMQMLQANAKADAQPFEDYAIFLYRQTAPKFEDRVKQIEKQFTYVPDQENRPSQFNRGMGKDEDIAAKIKSLESKFGHRQSVDKKPKDLLRAIGKIETSDWNIKEIEKKILENKMGKPSRAIDKEKVPKWSKEQFLARQNKMEQKHLERQTSEEVKFAEFDQSIKNLDQKLKEGTARELGQNKVASITEKLVGKIPTEQKPPEKTNRQPALPTPNNSEFCHFCKKRVYLMERLSAEGRFFHHGCFKCQYCNVQLRLGSYTFDRDGLYGYRFFCLQHFGMVREESPAKVTRAPSTKRVDRSSPEKKSLGIAGVDLLDKVQTPERIEFSNLSSGHVSSDQEDSLNQIDEDEWTDKNFGASCAEMEDSDEASSSFSDPDSDDEGAYDDALEEPVTKEGTLKWAERWKNSYSRKKRNSHSDEYSSSDQSSYYDSSDVVKKLMSLTRFMRLRFLRCEESDTATEGEEDIRARELRKREVCVEPPIVHTDTGTDTEIVTDESSSESSSEIQNSATEISTDSEFAQDDPTPTREIPSIVLNDMYVNKAKRSGYNPRRKIQVTSRYLQSPLDGKTSKPNIDLKLTPLVPSALPVKKPAPLVLTHPQGYSLNRTQSTGGIAAKVSLELKKKYLLGEASPGNIQKSGSVSTLDTKFKSFHTNISDCQKLLKPSPEISASMQTFCKKLNELKSPVLSPQPSIIFTKEVEQKEDDHKENGDVLDENDIKIEPAVFENESEGRPRSPLHETSIIVPQIDWSKQHDSLTSDSLASSDNENEQKSERFENIPKVEIHAINDDEEIKDEFVPDSLLCVNDEIKTDIESPSIEPLKSISSEKKILNQPKVLPNLESVFPEIHNALHIKHKIHKEREREVPETIVISSGLSSPESLAEQATTALTETELSDWARDEAMLDDFEDGEFEIHIKYPDKDQKPAKMADLLEFDDSTSSYLAKSRKDNVIETVNSVLNVNLDNIEFMDTGTETSSDDGVINSQDGYILLKDEDDFAEDSLNPNINDIVETTNINVLQYPKEETIKKETDLKQADLEPSKHVQDHEEDVSTLIIESGTTTEENTLTDSTVKHVSDITVDKTLVNEINTVDKNENCDLKNDVVEESKQKKMIDNNLEFQEHCQRLQNKIEFSNVKDSIDIRKSRKKSKQDVLQKPDLITEETANIVTPPKNISLNLTPHTPHTPDILYNKDVIKKERDINQKLIQEMVMNKMKAENKSLEKRKRNKAGMSPKSPFELTKSATVINVPLSHPSNVAQTTNKRHSGTYTTPDVLLSSKCPLQTSEDVNVKFIRSETTTTPVRTTPSYSNNHVSPNLDDTPKAPPRYHRSAEEMNRKLEKLKQTVRLRHKENEQLVHIKEKTDSASQKRDQTFRRCVSGNYEAACPTFSSLEQSSLSSNRAKSIPNFSQQITTVQTISLDPERIKVYKSDPNILETNEGQNKKKSKDRERRKSITKLITDFFTKKSPSSSGSKGLFSKLSPKSKEMSKSCSILDFKKAHLAREAAQRKCLSESFINRNASPPPVPPLPVNYTRKTDESSDGEEKHGKHDSSCDTLDLTGISTGSMAGRRSTKSRRVSRQAQLKRHRMAQELQRKLEETEVKMKELEDRGVLVEKSLRGEASFDPSKDEADLLQEWFDLMRDRTELRRFERELTVRAQELELEDRHARLQHELRERIENDKPKTKEDVETEESIINEMIEIVEKRDSLISEIEEDRLRYSNEDKDLEEQMLAKGLKLTPIKTSPEH
ncbi:F-actin-monooxygenase Mical isoform X3 [Diabrotica virgifera virgifera]|uniref:F-actin monooxygenase n=1 Tax=Diabrotica virgifera virgifera TaxID=50390 RepID=A0A6P7GK95_DIAVI|nr:F-actin-monooxygenase Mical isoform X3 [Diabrotica virgifera virgifera]